MNFSQHLKRCLTYTRYASITLFTASMTSAWYYRPIADNSSPNDDTETQSRGPDRSTQTFCTPYTSPPWSRSHTPFLLSCARFISIGATTLAIRLLMNTYGQYDIVQDEFYESFMQSVLHRDGDQGLITISNHRSLFDDPGIVSCLLPLHIAIQPKYNRWGICSQEYCFNDALPGIVKGYIGAGQVLPICRGGGINQKLLLDFGRHLASGEWCHIFPEGGVWQWEELGGRRELPKGVECKSSSDFGPSINYDDDSIVIPATKKHKALPQSYKGKLKWGVGKLIAHAPTTPKVIPFAHVGMERLLPQDEISGKTKLKPNLLQSMIPTFLGGDANDKLSIQIQFGQEIAFDDLITQHEERHGKLWKYSGRVDAEEELEKGQSAEGFHDKWDSSKEEKELYSKIVKRIEERLEVVTKEVYGKRS
jgi:monolysocardiolipin acyltransferase